MFDTSVIRTDDVLPSIYPHTTHPHIKTKTTTNKYPTHHNDLTKTHTHTHTHTHNHAANFCFFAILVTIWKHTQYLQTN